MTTPKRAPPDEPRPPPGSEEPAILPGTRYLILGKIASGGMGEVLDAEHIGLKKRVVVKVLHGHYQGRPDLLDRMRVEAQALAALNHPNIVQVSDFGAAADGRAYLVMERLYGRTLQEELKARGALPALEAIGIARQILAGLGAAHAIGVVHRDIKLENIFLCDAPEGEGPRAVKILDFGLVKIVADSSSPSGRAPSPLAFPTDKRIAVGTPRFFSPEQARGKKVDARSDIYSTGLVLYSLLAGRGPFDHIDPIRDLLLAHAVEDPEPPSRFAARPLAPDLERAVMIALAKKPDDRFPSAAAFSAELDAIAMRLAAAAPRKNRWEFTEPMYPTPKARIGGKETDRIPHQAAMIDAQKAALAGAQIVAAAAERAPPPAGSEATPGPLGPPIETERPSRAPQSRANRALVFALSVLAGAIVFGAAATALLLHLVR